MKPIYALLLVPCLLYGCAFYQVTEAQLYDFNSGMLSSAQFHDIEEPHGRITATLYDGEELHGEFTLTNEQSSTLPRAARLDFDQTLASDKHSKAEATSTPHTDKTIAATFGFTPDEAARPVGVATLVGNKGTVLQIVLYDLDASRGTGSGVGLDNKGNWYLVRIGT